VYRERRARIVAILPRDFKDYVDVVAASSGLHVTATARALSPSRIRAIAKRAADRDVAVQLLPSFAVGDSRHAGLVDVLWRDRDR
jgi:GntR family transcriptional regulator/MocR family aminotransferase